MSVKPVIFGCSDTTLSKDEKLFMRDADPWAYILFTRNVDTPLQMQRLIGDLRDAVGRNAAVFIDQEGGRVARLKQPTWREWAPVRTVIDAIAEQARDPEEADYYIYQVLADRYHAIGQDLRALGIDVNCVPLLDIPQPNAHDIIGDRALGDTPEAVAFRARAIIDGCERGGVMHIIKHIPGHGRANADSHLELPVVTTEREILEQTDFAPFKELCDEPMAMTAHIVYQDIDPDQCATCSPTMVQDVIRTHIGFEGLLMTDDLSMHALQGDFAERTRASLTAGCDIILHCNGDRPEMEAILSEVPDLTDKALERAQAVDTQREALECDTDTLSPDRLEAAGLLALELE